MVKANLALTGRACGTLEPEKSSYTQLHHEVQIDTVFCL